MFYIAYCRDRERAFITGHSMLAEGSEGPRWGSTSEAARLADISRDSLDRKRKVAEKAGVELPGTPVTRGSGTERRHLRWDLDRVHEYLAAWDAWHLKERQMQSQQEPAKKSARPRRRRRKRRGPATPTTTGSSPLARVMAARK